MIPRLRFDWWDQIFNTSGLDLHLSKVDTSLNWICKKDSFARGYEQYGKITRTWKGDLHDKAPKRANVYDKSATKIQALFRGRYARAHYPIDFVEKTDPPAWQAHLSDTDAEKVYKEEVEEAFERLHHILNGKIYLLDGRTKADWECVERMTQPSG